MRSSEKTGKKKFAPKFHKLHYFYIIKHISTMQLAVRHNGSTYLDYVYTLVYCYFGTFQSSFPYEKIWRRKKLL